MSLLVQVCIALAIWGFGFAAGWRVDTWKHNSEHAAELNQVIANQQAAEKERDAATAERDRISNRFEGKLANLRVVNKTITNEVRHELEKTVYGNPECAMPLPAVKLRNTAIDAANGETRPTPGKPDAAVPEARKDRGGSAPAVPGVDRGRPRGNQDVWGVRAVEASTDRRGESNPAIAALGLLQ